MQVYIPYHFRLQVQITQTYHPLFHWTWRGFAYDQPLMSNFCKDFLHLAIAPRKLAQKWQRGRAPCHHCLARLPWRWKAVSLKAITSSSVRFVFLFVDWFIRIRIVFYLFPFKYLHLSSQKYLYLEINPYFNPQSTKIDMFIQPPFNHSSIHHLNIIIYLYMVIFVRRCCCNTSIPPSSWELPCWAPNSIGSWPSGFAALNKLREQRNVLRFFLVCIYILKDVLKL